MRSNGPSRAAAGPCAVSPRWLHVPPDASCTWWGSHHSQPPAQGLPSEGAAGLELRDDPFAFRLHRLADARPAAQAKRTRVQALQLSNRGRPRRPILHGDRRIPHARYRSGNQNRVLDVNHCGSRRPCSIEWLTFLRGPWKLAGGTVAPKPRIVAASSPGDNARSCMTLSCRCRTHKPARPTRSPQPCREVHGSAIAPAPAWPMRNSHTDSKVKEAARSRA